MRLQPPSTTRAAATASSPPPERARRLGLPVGPWPSALLAVALGACAGVQPPQAVEAPEPAPARRAPEAPADPLHRRLEVTLAPAADGVLESAVIRADAPFTEVLPSWNVTGDVPFSVDVRTRASADAPWTPWLLIGDWGVTARPEDVVTACDEAEVAVDVLTASAPQAMAQLRFRAADGGALRPEDVRATVILTDTRALEARVLAAAEEAWPIPVQLSVPARSQRGAGADIGHRICSPTSVAMVAAFHGARVPTRTMAATLLDPHFDIYGNWNRAVQGAHQHGVPGELVRLSSWEAVAAYLRSGRPLVASIKADEGQLRGAPYERTGGHLLVVTGLGPGGVVHVNDPAAPWPGVVPRRYMRADMEQVWFGRGGVTYALAPPSPEAP